MSSMNMSDFARKVAGYADQLECIRICLQTPSARLAQHENDERQVSGVQCKARFAQNIPANSEVPQS